MTEPYILNRSFSFNGVDMYKKFGIRLKEMPKDVLLPSLRPRKREIPMRSGAYDYGAKYYDERKIELSCLIDRGLPFGDPTLREVAYFLSKKGRLILWNCPDKYYVGRIYDPVEKTQDLKISTEFILNFICDPFAYGESVNVNFGMAFSMRSPTNAYKGTTATPARFEITNPSTTNATNINIRISYRR